MTNETSPKQLREDLFAAIANVEGWLHAEEAWVLHELARAGVASGDPLVVEIGSWMGRSAIAMALGLRARGKGKIIAIDPHPSDERLRTMIKNFETAGVSDLVEIMRSTSHEARRRVEEPVDLLLIDGSHEYENVIQDIDDWTSALAPGAVVVFDDPYLKGVNRALLERVARRHSPYRNARWIVNKLVFDYRPGAAWSPKDEARRWRLWTMLRGGRRYMRIHWRLEKGAGGSRRVDAALQRAASPIFGLILPAVRSPSRRETAARR